MVSVHSAGDRELAINTPMVFGGHRFFRGGPHELHKSIARFAADMASVTFHPAPQMLKLEELTVDVIIKDLGEANLAKSDTARENFLHYIYIYIPYIYNSSSELKTVCLAVFVITSYSLQPCQVEQSGEKNWPSRLYGSVKRLSSDFSSLTQR